MPSDESDQPAHSQSDQTLAEYILDSQGCKVLHADNENDQTVQMHRLSKVFVKITC